MPRDNAGNEYVEVESWEEEGKAEQIRLTYIQEGFDGGPTIRIQVRESSGRLRQGPEMPTRVVSQVVKSLIDLLRLSTG